MKKIIPRAKKYNWYSVHDSWKFMLIGNVDVRLNKKIKIAHLVNLTPYILVGQRRFDSVAFSRIIGEPEIIESEFDEWDSDVFDDGEWID